MNPVPLQLSATAGTDAGVIAVFAAVTAIVGAFVAFLAYRGYQRNESHPMLYLALGIILLTTVPVGLNYGLLAVTAATDAKILLVITASHLAGVAAILYALTRA